MTSIWDTVTNNNSKYNKYHTFYFCFVCQTEDQRLKMSAKKQLFLLSCLDCQGSCKKSKGRVSTLYQIKEDELFLEWMQVMCTQVAKLNANIPAINSLALTQRFSTWWDKLGAKPKLIIIIYPSSASDGTLDSHTVEEKKWIKTFVTHSAPHLINNPMYTWKQIRVHIITGFTYAEAFSGFLQLFSLVLWTRQE